MLAGSITVPPHYAGFFPAQYAHPNNDPNAVGAAYPFYLNFTQ